MTFLVDTNVISEIRRKEPDQHVTTWLRGLRTEQIFLSVLTVGELRTGILRLGRRDSARARALDDWVSGLEQTYADRILPVTHAVAVRWAAINAARPLPGVDSLIAATAIEHGLTVATRNEKDFSATGAAVFNPFA
ncbi:type II toxin-antitoxin system VapC family toxin [Antribacter sp. KLBMP9083]|uniref:Ribonuclease VapC n=1 Tax=Antribacter soli TaxID=2910976 RepID=A0AA41QE35_9MICO|nr:type II toxin-antitoxin system VapC family toxin [Antribacter soli]MCF4121451.1 type II toxin-antitoxin system VapC family toxin [Antribacter soli]